MQTGFQATINKASIVRRGINYFLSLPMRLAWFIPELRWWDRKGECFYCLSFWGPHQVPWIMFVKEDLDENGHVEWASILFTTTSLTPSSVHQWWKRRYKRDSYSNLSRHW